MSATPTRGLIDGDIVVYRVGFAANDVSEKLALARVDQFIDNIMIAADLTSITGFITGTKEEYKHVQNFRELIAVTQPYKGNRSGTKPAHYAAIRNHLRNKYKFAYQYTQEADDAIAIEATKFRDEVVICSIDKDLLQVPGFHYNFVNQKIDYVTDEEGLRTFYRQILTGDRVDNVPGVGGVGPVKAAKRIPDTMVDEIGMYNAVVYKYWESYDNHTRKSLDKAKKDVLERGRLLWLRREPEQLWLPPSERKQNG